MSKIKKIAQKHGVSEQTARQLLEALRRGNGSMAQFDIPELGGMGQWMPGMIMVGDMFNQQLKSQVDGLCRDLLGVAQEAPAPSKAGKSGGSNWWPADLGQPSAVGEQGGMRYAVFPERRRLVIEQGGRRVIYDTLDHRIGGVSQQQSGSKQTLTFTSQKGTVPVSKLRTV